MRRAETPRIRVIYEDDRWHVNIHARGYQIVDRAKPDFDGAIIADRGAAYGLCDQMNRQWRREQETAA